MTNKIILALFITLASFLFLGCAQQPVEEPTPEEAPATVESIEEVGTGISDIAIADEELNADDLNDLEDTLASIENI